MCKVAALVHFWHFMPRPLCMFVHGCAGLCAILTGVEMLSRRGKRDEGRGTRGEGRGARDEGRENEAAFKSPLIARPSSLSPRPLLFNSSIEGNRRRGYHHAAMDREPTECAEG